MNATTQTLQVNGLRMQVTTAGTGPLVLLCHGFPAGAASFNILRSANRLADTIGGPDSVTFAIL